MTKKFKRGYVIENKKNDYYIAICNVIQNDDFGKFEDEDEEEIKRFSGYQTKEEATKELKELFKVKEIVFED